MCVRVYVRVSGPRVQAALLTEVLVEDAVEDRVDAARDGEQHLQREVTHQPRGDAGRNGLQRVLNQAPPPPRLDVPSTQPIIPDPSTLAQTQVPQPPSELIRPNAPKLRASDHTSTDHEY